MQPNNMKNGVWQKRFKRPLHQVIRDFCDSTRDDKRLIASDIAACLAHVKMLGKCAILNKSETKILHNRLKGLMVRYRNGRFKMHAALEDVHMNIEHALRNRNDKVADKLHTARSRNDLIATDLRLYARDSTIKIIKALIALQKRLIQSAERNSKIVIPGNTHMQPAQPITWSFYMLAQFNKFDRDVGCLKDALKRIEVSPLGSAALAGTSHPIDIKLTASLLKFNRTAGNALDAVSDRDFLTELLFICSQIAVHISSFCEDMVIYSHPDHGLIDLDAEISTGSSIMPQKKNPDVFELLRAKAGNAIGSLCAALTMLKGLPSSYNRDLQEIKPLFFRQVDETIKCLSVLAFAVTRLKVVEQDWVYQPDFMCATDIVDYLVKKGKPFRQAYDLVADCIGKADDNVYSFIRLCAESSDLDENTIKQLMTPYYAVRNRVSSNSTGYKAVRRALKSARKHIAK